MSLSTRSRNWWKGFSFTPSLEALADRAVPSVTTAFENGVLTLTGDAADDIVSIVAQEDGSYEVDVGGGSQPETFEDVAQIVADLGERG